MPASMFISDVLPLPFSPSTLENFAAAHGQIHVLIGDHRAEMLGDAAHLDHCVGLQSCSLRGLSDYHEMKERQLLPSGGQQGRAVNRVGAVLPRFDRVDAVDDEYRSRERCAPQHSWK